MKKILCLLLALLMCSFALASCGVTPAQTDDSTSADTATDAAPETKTFNVGVLKLLQHVALDAAAQGFQEELTKLVEASGNKVVFDLKDGNNDTSTMTTISNTFVANKVDLVLAVATPAAQALLSVTSETNIPTLFTAVTDAEEAKLVETNDKPGGNMTGTSDLNPVADQLALITELVPGVKKVGVLYTTSEKNSEVQVNLLQAACDANNIELVKKGITAENEIQAALVALNNEAIEALYLPTDNILANAAQTVHAYNLEGAKLPIVCGESGMNALCGVATYSVDYYNLGAQTAQMAYKILVDGTAPADIPVEYYAKTSTLSINQNIADELGFVIPQTVLDKVSK